MESMESLEGTGTRTDAPHDDPHDTRDGADGRTPPAETPADAATPDASATPTRPLPEILADWQRRIEDYRAGAARSGAPGVWQTVYDIDREELARVLAAVPTVTIGDDIDPETIDGNLAVLERWTRGVLGMPQDTIIAVTAPVLWQILHALLTRLRDEAREVADRVRVHRMVVYEGARVDVEEALRRSLHGSRALCNRGGTITAVTLDVVPERMAPAARDLELEQSGEELDRG